MISKDIKDHNEALLFVCFYIYIINKNIIKKNKISNKFIKNIVYEKLEDCQDIDSSNDLMKNP